MKIGSLCTGYGGLDLAAEAYFNAEAIWCAEIDKYASQVIDKRFGIPNYGDIKQIKWAELPKIDILTAGYPCQPFSHAGERKGTDDPRHIFPYIAEAINALRPSYFIFENVRGHLSLGFKEVLEILAPMGYVIRWGVVRASDAGANHRRERLFIFGQLKSAYSDFARLQGSWNEANDFTDGSITDSNSNARQESQRTNSKFSRSTGQIIDRPNRQKRWSGFEITKREIPSTLDQNKLNPKYVEYMMGLPNGWVTDCNLSNTQQLKMLGNGVVPQQAYLALELLNGEQHHIPNNEIM